MGWTARTVTIMAVAMALPATVALAQERYPAREIHMFTAFPPGGGADVLTRYFAGKIGDLARQPVIVENKVGASGMLATEHVARAKPDGYSVLMIAGQSLASNYSLFRNKPVNPSTDLQMAATVSRAPYMLAVSTNSPYKTLSELIAGLRQKGPKASYAQSNSMSKVVAELFKAAFGLEATEVAYRGAADALNDMASGAVDFAVLEPYVATSEARNGRLRLLAVTTSSRAGILPDVPTLAESGMQGVDFGGWMSLALPAATPRPIVDQINRWMREISAREETRNYLIQSGSGEPWILSPDEAQARLVKEQKEWEGHIKVAKIVPQG